ncbi:hypothetical protein [Rhodanobacter sp. PCA2]|uniref:hypothetical protein n=1 Tax=Rhodanobacter sp. PCA2 TaxID=2006117 RepID=UPI0015E7CAA8|nr:hypothetical protein [Rhodanobacter sp. PCA2]MBA2079610.1 hypothetical protein [Rhodanobacter sp. PCA2]
MNSSPKSTTTHADRVAEPLAGDYVTSAPLPGKGDLSDWVELMEAVEALCPVWPERPKVVADGSYKL